MNRRAYEEIRSMVEQHGGTMTFQREGFQVGGAWIVRYSGKESVFHSGGGKFPGLDELYIPNIANPKTWDDYSNVLVDDSWDKLLHLINERQH